MILKLQTLTADISRNSFMYSNTFESYDFNYVTGVCFTKVFMTQFNLCPNLVMEEHLKFELMSES